MSNLHLNGRAALIEYILEYESDTFSAEASKPTKKEAEEIADRLIAHWMDDRLDGIAITNLLDSIRE